MGNRELEVMIEPRRMRGFFLAQTDSDDFMGIGMKYYDQGVGSGCPDFK